MTASIHPDDWNINHNNTIINSQPYPDKIVIKNMTGTNLLPYSVVALTHIDGFRYDAYLPISNSQGDVIIVKDFSGEGTLAIGAIIAIQLTTIMLARTTGTIVAGDILGTTAGSPALAKNSSGFIAMGASVSGVTPVRFFSVSGSIAYTHGITSVWFSQNLYTQYALPSPAFATTTYDGVINNFSTAPNLESNANYTVMGQSDFKLKIGAAIQITYNSNPSSTTRGLIYNFSNNHIQKYITFLSEGIDNIVISKIQLRAIITKINFNPHYKYDIYIMLLGVDSNNNTVITHKSDPFSFDVNPNIPNTATHTTLPFTLDNMLPIGRIFKHDF